MTDLTKSPPQNTEAEASFLGCVLMDSDIMVKVSDIVDEDEVELVKKMMEETGKEIDVLIETKYFKSELEELRDKKTTEKATSDIRGGKGGTKASDSPEYWIAKGVPPTTEQVPDKKTRVAIARAMMANASTSGKKFYND